MVAGWRLGGEAHRVWRGWVATAGWRLDGRAGGGGGLARLGGWVEWLAIHGFLFCYSSIPGITPPIVKNSFGVNLMKIILEILFQATSK